MRKQISSQSGFATLIALIMVAMLSLIGLAALSTSDDDANIAGNQLQEMRAFYAAEAGLEQAAAILEAEYDSTGAPPTVMPSGTDEVNGCQVAFSCATDGVAGQTMLTHGTLVGLHALVNSFSLTSVAVNAADRAKVEMAQTFETALVPIFQFAIFYGNDLEIAPGPAMNLMGRVHTNGDLWVQAGDVLNMDSYMTAAGSILHGRKGPGGVSAGDVLIKDANGNYVSMKEGAGWLDANDAHWYDSSAARWQGRVQDSTHGQAALNVPLTQDAAGDPHKLIEPASGNPDSYETKADLKFIDRRAYQMVDTLWVDVTDSMVSTGVITFTNNQFTDQREAKNVDLMELDIGKMYDEGFDPSGGVIYYSDRSLGPDFPAMRVSNADELDDGLTIASENPVYTLGDFNSVNKKPAAILADAVTFLSSAWDDLMGGSSVDDREAVNTTVNASYLTGNIETTVSNYNGGFENLPRFLEKWGGKDFNWSGSAVNLWSSVQATGNWNGTYYTPPNRNWQYDSDLDDPANIPPETPVIRVFQRTGWRQEYVGYSGE
ncbi:MAG: hypothetical protein KAU35_02705 [candidate division Zixibacteria bacterium]|nr:hypothetical protein [candidate division Zixibacteria bacterium]